jgi:CRISPR-associated protein Cas2
MYYLICYDVNTETKEGRKRLRKVCQACKNFGQRAQKSVFEVDLTPALHQRLISSLLKIIDEEEDSLRVYRIAEPLEKNVQHWGIQLIMDLDGPVIF